MSSSTGAASRLTCLELARFLHINLFVFVASETEIQKIYSAAQSDGSKMSSKNNLYYGYIALGYAGPPTYTSAASNQPEEATGWNQL